MAVAVMEERRHAWRDFEKAIDQIQADAKDSKERVEAHRKQQQEIADKVTKTATKVEGIERSVDRIATNIETLTKDTIEARVTTKDTRADLEMTKKQVGALNELVLRHDERLDTKIPVKLFAIIGVASALIYVGFIFDPDAMKATVAAIKGLFK